LLRFYYTHLFPYRWYFQWLNYGPVPSPNFSHREFSFTLADDIYIRYQSFKDAEALKQDLIRLVPVKIDIGAIYTARPKEKKSLRPEAFQTVEKELVFDIDMTDYDEIRTCCSGGKICPKCWSFMTIAIRILDTALREDFGFQHLLWVYSGRRGVHCWVADARARRLSNEARRAIVGWLEVIKGGSQQARKVMLPGTLPPTLDRSYKMLEEYFTDVVLRDQGVLDEEESWTKVLHILPDDGLRKYLHASWSSSSGRQKTGREKWDELCRETERFTRKKNRVNYLRNGPRDIVFQYCYPRLDDKVSIQMNHLLKSPFCVHPKTGRVCVPIDPVQAHTFDPFSVPTIQAVVEEAMTLLRTRSSQGRRKKTLIEDTVLAPHITYFRTFVRKLLGMSKEGGTKAMLSRSSSSMLLEGDPMEF
ncbi:hypothetical protein BJ684DRAFT_7735, partial [Piptocephalis cylindrospora]